MSNYLPFFGSSYFNNSKCRYGERGAADAKSKAQIILDAAKVSAASGGILATQMPCRSRRSGA